MKQRERLARLVDFILCRRRLRTEIKQLVQQAVRREESRARELEKEKAAARKVVDGLIHIDARRQWKSDDVAISIYVARDMVRRFGFLDEAPSKELIAKMVSEKVYGELAYTRILEKAPYADQG